MPITDMRWLIRPKPTGEYQPNGDEIMEDEKVLQMEVELWGGEAHEWRDVPIENE